MDDYVELAVNEIPNGIDYVITGSSAIEVLLNQQGLNDLSRELYPINDIDIVLQPETIISISHDGVVRIGGEFTNFTSQGNRGRTFDSIRGIKVQHERIPMPIELISLGVGNELPDGLSIVINRTTVKIINPHILIDYYDDGSSDSLNKIDIINNLLPLYDVPSTSPPADHDYTVDDEEDGGMMEDEFAGDMYGSMMDGSMMGDMGFKAEGGDMLNRNGSKISNSKLNKHRKHRSKSKKKHRSKSKKKYRSKSKNKHRSKSKNKHRRKSKKKHRSK